MGRTPRRSPQNEALNRYLDVLDGRLLRPGNPPIPGGSRRRDATRGRSLKRWGAGRTPPPSMIDWRELPSQRASWELRAGEARRRLVNGGAVPPAGAVANP